MSSRRSVHLPAGFHDRIGASALAEMRVTDSFFQHAALYGCSPIYLSPVSFSATFLYGNESASDWVYRFLDKSQRELILNPDSLPAVLRCYASNVESRASTRWCFSAPIFRYKHMKLRYYHHIGATFINEHPSPYFGELIADMMVEYLLGEFKCGFLMKLNSFDVWLDLLATHGIEESDARELLRIMNHMSPEERVEYVGRDVGNLALRATLNDLAAIEPTSPNEEALERLQQIIPATSSHMCHALWQFAQARQKAARLQVIIDVNDLHAGAFHSGIAFQIYSDTRPSRLGDGGSYHVVGHNIDPSVHSVYSTILRLEDAAELYGKPAVRRDIQLYLYVMLPAEQEFRNLIASLRASGIIIWEETEAMSPGSAIKRAVAAGAEYFGMLGERELASRNMEMRHLGTRHAQLLGWTEILPALAHQ